MTADAIRTLRATAAFYRSTSAGGPFETVAAAYDAAADQAEARAALDRCTTTEAAAAAFLRYHAPDRAIRAGGQRVDPLDFPARDEV